MKSSFAVAIAVGLTAAALARRANVPDALRREAALLGLRAYLAAVDRGAPHDAFVSELRHIDREEDGTWLVRAYGAPIDGDGVPTTASANQFHQK